MSGRRAGRHHLVEYYLGGKRRPPVLKEEFWQDDRGNVTRYSLAYIDPELFHGDNGRVLGYDNARGHHHKHLFGEETEYRFTTYTALVRRFEREVAKIRGEK
jgi:hypothetical protein